MTTTAKIPFAVMTVGGTDYRLKINTQAAIDAEKKLGTSIPRAWVRLDETEVQVTILWAALQAFNSGMTFEETIRLRDRFLDEADDTLGMEALADIIKEVYICSGFMKREQPKKDEDEEVPEEKTAEN